MKPIAPFDSAPMVGLLACTCPFLTQAAETEVTGSGKVQLEFKAAVTHDDSIALREKSTPFLARVGLNETMELRLATEGHISISSTEQHLRRQIHRRVGTV